MGKIMKYGVEYSGTGGSGGGDANDTELTWDEYQELTEEEKNNGTNYYITDVNSDGMDGRFQPVMYSTKERVIGVWTNGKPLYERCLQAEESVVVYGDRDQSFPVSGITNKYVNEILPTLDKITKAELICNNENTYYYNYPIGFLHGNGQFKRIDSPNVAWIGSRIIGGSYLVLQYTKTTDGAGSGQWTPQGVPACHYSEDEQVVGTWVDGKPIYEKTITFNSPISGSVSIAHNISNLDTVISANGAVHDNWDPATWIPHPRIASDGNNIGISNISSTTIVFYVPTIFSNRIHKGHIIIRYTKTTD